MKNYEEVLKLLEKEFDWNLVDTLSKTGKKLVLDTLKAREKIDIKLIDEPICEKNWFEKQPLHWRFFYYIAGGVAIGLMLSYIYTI